MLAVIERGLYARQPPRDKLSPSERALPSHVVNLAGIRPTSEVRRRQLVMAQRRSREKSRQLKLLVATKEHLAKEVETLQAQHKAHVTAYHASLARRFLDYLAFYAHGMPSIATPSQVKMEADLFSDAVPRRWLEWASVFPIFRLTFLSSEVLSLDDCSGDLLLRVSMEMTVKAHDKPFPEANNVLPLTSVDAPVGKRATIPFSVVAYFDGGKISRIEPEVNISMAIATAGGMPQLLRAANSYKRSNPVEEEKDSLPRKRSKASVAFILNQVFC
ncbi:hypothetical protein AC1031_011741 [Aphanomyces cochlioides]|nr:hypothetical protein AC1031_011741 [Aphanomyces cochlioides]